MQAAVHRLAVGQGRTRAGKTRANPPFAVADDSGLLDALPIAAAIVERGNDRRLVVAAHNHRFFDTVRQSTCDADEWNEADCLQTGPIGELIQSFFDGDNVAGELDSGFYVNFVFRADSQLITKLRTKLKLDPEVYRHHYQRLSDKKVALAKKRVAVEK